MGPPAPEVAAGTDGRRIWIDTALTKAERRSFLAHETFHTKHGHTGCQPPAVEREICLEVAQFLIPFEDLGRVAGWARHPADMTEELEVTAQVTFDRLQTLNGDQIQTLWPPGEYFA